MKSNNREYELPLQSVPNTLHCTITQPIQGRQKITTYLNIIGHNKFSLQYFLIIWNDNALNPLLSGQAY